MLRAPFFLHIPCNLQNKPQICRDFSRKCGFLYTLQLNLPQNTRSSVSVCNREKEMAADMLNIVLVEPEIPQNCGNIARTCAATGSRLHLVRPWGSTSREGSPPGGLDYWHLVEVFDYEDLGDLFRRHPEAERTCGSPPPRRPGPMRPPASRRTAGSSSARRPPGCPWPSGRSTGTVRPPAHGVRRPEPEPQQHRGRVRLRGPAPE